MAGKLIPEKPPLFDPTLPPSSSLLFYLFAEQVAPRALLGTRAPEADVRVNTAHLGRTLLAVAFWYLRESGLVRVEMKQERKFLKTKTCIEVALAESGTPARRDGIEGGILDVLTPGSLRMLTPAWHDPPQWAVELAEGYAAHLQRAIEELAARPEYANLPNLAQLKEQHTTSHRAPPATIVDAIRAWYGRAITSPEHLPISWTEQEGVAKGFLMEGGERNPLATAVFGKASALPDRTRIALAEPAFVQLHERWQTFNDMESDLAQELAREVAGGIEHMRHIPPTTH